MPSVRYWEVVAVARKRCSTVSRTSLRILRNSKRKTRVWGFHGRTQRGVFGQGILRPEGRLLWIGGEEVLWAEPWYGCALRSFFFTLIYRNAKEIPQDPGAGKLW